MSPLLYLQLKKFKNRFKEFLHTPSEIIIGIAFVLILFSAFFTEGNIYPERNSDEFFAIVFIIYSFSFVMSGKNGFISGASMFSMADVNLLFTAPFKQKKVLSYGLVQQLGKNLALSFIILYQSQTVKDVYGYGFKELFFVFIGLGLTGLMSQMFSMVIYSLTSHSDRLRTVGKTVFYGFVGAFILVFTIILYSKGFTLENAVAVLTGKLSLFFPVSSIVTLAVKGAVTGNLSCVLWGVCCFAVYCALYFLVINKTKKDFYEDVLKSAEVSFSAITAQKEGKTSSAAPRNVKKGKIGFSKGFGSDIIREKMKIENRRSKVLFISFSGFLSVLLSVICCFISSGSVFLAFIMNVYTLSFTVTTGNWAKELRYPYIYLIPEKPFKKLVSLISASLPSLLFESVLCSVPMYFILDCTVFEVTAISFARFSFGLMFMSINLILQRIYGNSDKKTISMMTYMLFVMLFSLPSSAAGIFAYMFMPFYYIVPFLIMTAVCGAESLILIYLSRNILEKSEINNK